jgi:hypothetical protein
MEEKKINTRTLGGWLILVQIIIILNAISWVGNLQTYYGLLGEKDKLIKSQNPSDPGLYVTFIYYELAASLVMTFLSFAAFYYFFKRNRNFPVILTIYLSLQIILEGLSFMIFSSIIPPGNNIIYQRFGFTAAISVILIFYVWLSKRVKLTFIH